MGRIGFRAWAILGAATVFPAVWFACVPEDPGELVAIGTDGGACNNGACALPGLACVNNVCVPAPQEAGSEAGTPDAAIPDCPTDSGLATNEVACGNLAKKCIVRSDAGPQVCCNAADCKAPNACAGATAHACDMASQCGDAGFCCLKAVIPATTNACPIRSDLFQGTYCSATPCKTTENEVCRTADPRGCADAGKCYAARVGSQALDIGVCIPQ
jgi:hypothetical protein